MHLWLNNSSYSPISFVLKASFTLLQLQLQKQRFVSEVQSTEEKYSSNQAQLLKRYILKLLYPYKVQHLSQNYSPQKGWLRFKASGSLPGLIPSRSGSQLSLSTHAIAPPYHISVIFSKVLVIKSISEFFKSC